MATARLTKRTVDAASPADGKDVFVWDDTLSGFGLKVTSTGRKVYLVQYRIGGRGAPTKRVTIGRHGTPWTAEQARREATQILGAVAAGEDPAAKRREKRQADANTVADVVARFVDRHVEMKKPKTAIEYRRMIDQHIVPRFGKKPIGEVTRADIDRLHHELRATPYQANRLLAVLSKLLSWAEAQGLRADGSNPCRHVQKFKERKRERYLSQVELGRLGAALKDAEAAASPYAIAAIRLLVFTGARLNEILTLRWAYIDNDAGVIRLPDSKTGAKEIHLNPLAMSVLATLPRTETNPWVICGARQGAHMVNINKTWREVRTAAGLDDVRIHDLRHSFASVGAGLGNSLVIIGGLLGHREAATTARYAHLAADPLKAASNAISQQIADAMEMGRGMGGETPPGAEVVAHKRPKVPDGR